MHIVEITVVAGGDERGQDRRVEQTVAPASSVEGRTCSIDENSPDTDVHDPAPPFTLRELARLEEPAEPLLDTPGTSTP